MEKKKSVEKNSCGEVVINNVIIWLCLTRIGNYRIHEFDWLKSKLKAVKIFPRPAFRPVMFCGEKVAI